VQASPHVSFTLSLTLFFFPGVLTFCLYSQIFTESISSIAGGVVGSPDDEEVTVATYSGRIYGLTKNQAVPGSISSEVQAKLVALK